MLTQKQLLAKVARANLLLEEVMLETMGTNETDNKIICDEVKKCCDDILDIIIESSEIRTEKENVRGKNNQR